MVLLAGIVTVMLIGSEIAAIAPSGRLRRLRTLLLWGALPVVVLFGAAWFVYVQRLLASAP